MSDAYVPMPDTCHPWYADKAEGIRSHLHLPAVMVMETPQLSASFFSTASPLEPISASSITRVLTVKKCAGPAPYVGDPMFAHRVYFWRVAVDDLGRHVAGNAQLSEPSFRQP